MNLAERIAYLCARQHEAAEETKEPSPLCQKAMESALPAELPKAELTALASELNCPEDYLCGKCPFADVAFLWDNRAEISVHLKLALMIRKRKTEVLQNLRFSDYLWILDEFADRVAARDGGIDVIYK